MSFRDQGTWWQPKCVSWTPINSLTNDQAPKEAHIPKYMFCEQFLAIHLFCYGNGNVIEVTCQILDNCSEESSRQGIHSLLQWRGTFIIAPKNVLDLVGRFARIDFAIRTQVAHILCDSLLAANSFIRIDLPENGLRIDSRLPPSDPLC